MNKKFLIVMSQKTMTNHKKKFIKLYILFSKNENFQSWKIVSSVLSMNEQAVTK